MVVLILNFCNKKALLVESSAFLLPILIGRNCYLVQVLHGFGHGFGHVTHFGHRSGAFMQPMAFAVDCNMLHGCPHVTHGLGCGHVLHGFTHLLHFPHPDPASAGTENITATATTNTNTASFLIITPPFT
jgi:hypothetical protein